MAIISGNKKKFKQIRIQGSLNQCSVRDLGICAGPARPGPHDPHDPGLLLLFSDQHHRLPDLPQGLEAGASLCFSVEVVDLGPAVHGHPHGALLHLPQLRLLHHNTIVLTVAGCSCLAC